MLTSLQTAFVKYLNSASPSRGTRGEYQTTLRKWTQWGGEVPIERLGRGEIREFLDWVYARAVAEEGTNPGRTTNDVVPLSEVRCESRLGGLLKHYYPKAA